MSRLGRGIWRSGVDDMVSTCLQTFPSTATFVRFKFSIPTIVTKSKMNDQNIIVFAETRFFVALIVKPAVTYRTSTIRNQG